jgi:hypothetical protein
MLLFCSSRLTHTTLQFCYPLGYSIVQALPDGSENVLTDFDVSNHEAIQFYVPRLLENSRFMFRVAALNEVNVTFEKLLFSTQFEYRTTPITLPTAPLQLSAANITGGAIVVTWQPPLVPTDTDTHLVICVVAAEPPFIHQSVCWAGYWWCRGGPPGLYCFHPAFFS